MGIIKNIYGTPCSPLVHRLPTNFRLTRYVRNEGMTVQQRPADIDKAHTIYQIVVSGTAVVITAVHDLAYRNEIIQVPINLGKVK